MPFNPLQYPLTFATPNYISDASAWVQHIPFAFTITTILRPKSFVELGTHMGDSYLAFCQAIKALGIEAQCAAIDTWQGDSHTGPYANPLPQLRANHDPHYASFSRLLQTDFDSARPTFADGSIDLLHIDGLHTYEAVKHDYDSWLPKLSSRGVVLFHDTTVTHGDFGVHRFFAELAAKHPTFNFHHGFGLGIVAPNAETPAAMQIFLTEANADADAVRNCYATLGHRMELLKTMYMMIRRSIATQVTINTARRARNLPVDPQSERADVAFSNPNHYLDYQAKTIEELLARSNQPTFTIGR